MSEVTFLYSSVPASRLRNVLSEQNYALYFVYYRIAQNFRWIKISLNTQALYWHKNFAEFNFAHSANYSPGSSGWSSRMNTPVRHGRISGTVILTHASLSTRSISLYIPRFLLPLLFACCTPFTAALASAMAEGDSSTDRGPEGSGKTRGATWK